MSIINDALKKTEASIQRNSLKKTPGLDKKPKFKTFLLYSLMLAAILLLGGHIFKTLNHKIVPPQVSEPPQAVPIQAPLATPAPLPEEQPKPEKKFVLNGIFFSDDNGYALVNNQIVKENDSVEGAKVEKITVDTVEINNEGKIITLSTGK
ncbi:MAG: hypothetical protein PHC71_02575 [Candidatus Omnitrophica bacterium]|nr:hypothetical protein [Candidatus Omnitrophota bacterium]